MLEREQESQCAWEGWKEGQQGPDDVGPTGELGFSLSCLRILGGFSTGKRYNCCECVCVDRGQLHVSFQSLSIFNFEKQFFTEPGGHWLAGLSDL